jgi:putative hemolysin
MADVGKGSRFPYLRPRLSALDNTLESFRLLSGRPSEYTVRLAAELDEIRAAQEVRFEVFNVELEEGLAESHATGRDEDPYDSVCDHLIVEHLPTGKVVGTYRLQTGSSAAEHLGYYCAQEFDLELYEGHRAQILELGRACVHEAHRNFAVLGMLWRGIADYATKHGTRYFIGCSSLTSQDPAVGAAAYAELARKHLSPPAWRTTPLPGVECPLDPPAATPPKIPKLLRGYLGLGAWICGPPALDREFKTIDFLTLLDLNAVSRSARQRFLGG